jgi:hypothetical protein
MKLFEHFDTPDLFGIDSISVDEFVGLYNVCLNYKSYLQEIVKLDNANLVQIAPGMDVKLIRSNLALQQKTCDDIITLWNERANVGKKKLSN